MNRRGFIRTAAIVGAASAALNHQKEAEAVAAVQGRNTSESGELSLNGEWCFKADPEGQGVRLKWFFAPAEAGREGWQKATVPGCWEREGQPGIFVGPAWYRRDVTVPPSFRGAGRRVWWEMDAVSYHAEGYVNGQMLGEHTGLWDAFAWEIPPALLQADGALNLALSVEKPGSTRFPLRETMAGFLPYVWGTWGGPWQSTRLRVTGPCCLRAVFAPGTAKGEVSAEADIDLAAGSGEVSLIFALTNHAGIVVANQIVKAQKSGTVAARLQIPQPNRWTLDQPYLYTLTVTATVGGFVSDTRTRRVGLRDIAVDGEKMLLNGQPLFFRAPLSWGWYEKERAPHPPADVFEQELRRVKALGFNGMKLCLWVPPQAYFEIADRLGMLLWVELPMWLPQGTDFCRRQTPGEYERIVRQVADHPSVALYTLGCEIGQGVDSAFMGDLYDRVKKATRNAIVRDNSGSAECYGGPLPEHADYWDFHLYCDLPQARVTFDSFAPRWRSPQPFLFGEFNDQDALRDLPGLMAAREGDMPWWAQADPRFNPQGARWEYGVTLQLKRMGENGLMARLAELREGSRRQALLTRKHTLELTRSYPFMSGYVVTGLCDTPITSAGIFDDFGNSRFSGEEFTPFNADMVLFIEPDRRREWTAGGDRPSWQDRWGVRSGEKVRRHIGVSHFGEGTGTARLEWKAIATNGKELARGEAVVKEVKPGFVGEIGLIEFAAPASNRPQKIFVHATFGVENGGRTSNSWPVWVYPKAVKEAARRVGIFDPTGQMEGFAEAVGLTPVPLHTATGEPLEGGGPVNVLLATTWRPQMSAFVRNGGNLLLVQPGESKEHIGDGLPAVALAFWREAMRLFEPHPSWGDFPHEKTTDFCFYGLASDAAFDVAKVQIALGADARLAPVLTRVDARSFALHAYTLAVQMGAGKMLLTTLRPQGGLGDQPSGLVRHTSGAYLLRTWLDWLS